MSAIVEGLGERFRIQDDLTWVALSATPWAQRFAATLTEAFGRNYTAGQYDPDPPLMRARAVADELGWVIVEQDPPDPFIAGRIY